jgi:hypothetical protein
VPVLLEIRLEYVLLGLELNFLDNNSHQMDVEKGIESLTLESPNRYTGKKFKQIKVMEFDENSIRKIKYHSMFEETI